MTIIQKLEALVKQISEYVSQQTEESLSLKPNPTKWSKKELIGHLIDSGVNNLKRFTEIQFHNKPFSITPYQQEELVRANNYQDAESSQLLQLLIALNHRIADIINTQTPATLRYEVVTSDHTKFDFKFLIEDYVAHFEHHTQQILT